jgi:hypothetical protein
LALRTRSETVLLELVEIDLDNFESLPMPAWLPDGKSLLLPLETDRGVGMFKISDDGKVKTRLTPEGTGVAPRSSRSRAARSRSPDVAGGGPAGSLPLPDGTPAPA